MPRNFLYRTLATAALATSLLAGCASEHAKFVKKDEDGFASTRMSMLYQAADQQYKVGELDKCRESIKQAIAADPKHPYAPLFILAGRVELEGGSLENAVTDLKKAVEVDGKNPESFYLLGVVYQRWQKFDEAADYYQHAAEKKPDDATYVVAVAEMRIALGQLDEAKQYLTDKMFYFEQSASMRIAMARIAALQGDHVGAVREYRDAALLLPEDKNLQFTYATALFDAGKYSDASKILEEIRKDPPVLPKAPKAGADDAETDAQAAISNKVGLLMTLGECYVNLNRPLDARDCFQEAVRTQPTNASAFLSLGKICLVTGEFNLVEESTARVLRLDPQNVDAMILQAAVEQKEKKWSESMATLAGAARVSPKDPAVLCMAGISAIQLGKKDSAAAFFQQALAASPGDSWATELLQSVRPAAPAPLPAEASPAPVPAPETASAALPDLSNLEPFALALTSEDADLTPGTADELSSAVSVIPSSEALTNAQPAGQ